MKIRIQHIIIGFILYSCSSFEDAELTSRNGFVHFYSSGVNFTGSVAEIDLDGGYILAGEIKKDDNNSDAILIKTDGNGKTIWQKIIENGTISAIKPLPNGYLVLGDRIESNPGSNRISEIINTQARLVLMNNVGEIQFEFIKRDSIITQTDTLQIDFHGNALAVDNQGDLLILGSYKVPGNNERSFVSAFNSTTFAAKWTQTYGLIDRDYVNCNSLHVTGTSKLVWASKTLRQIQNISREYVSISFVEPNSTFENNSLYGENDTRNHSVEDIQPAAVGFGAIGTYSEADGGNANIYFVRIDQSGNVIPNSAKYFDGVDLALADRDVSKSEDHGLAITSTNGGYIIAGQMTSTPVKGSGGTDIILIKVDSFGNLVWSRLIGGTGNETVNSIRETSDGGFVLCGTNTINNLSSIMLVKTNADGQLTN